MTPEVNTIIVLAIVAIVIAIPTYKSWMHPKRVARRKLKRARIQRICDVEDGQVVKLEGQVRFVGVPLQAPISGLPCAYYELVMSQPSTEANWKEVAREAYGAELFVVDDTGKAIVELYYATVSAPLGHHVQVDRAHPPTPHVSGLLQGHGVETDTVLGVRPTHLREAIVDESMRASVMGMARWERDPDADGGFRQQQMRLRIEPLPGDELLVHAVRPLMAGN